jgi:hypothetical protein
MQLVGAKPDDALDDDVVVIRRVPSFQLHPRADGKREVSKGSFRHHPKTATPRKVCPLIGLALA